LAAEEGDIDDLEASPKGNITLAMSEEADLQNGL
jgi:hypothetical protein